MTDPTSKYSGPSSPFLDLEAIEGASMWVARVETGEMSQAEHDELEAWLGKSPSHRKAFAEMAQFSSSFDILHTLPPLAEPERSKARRGVSWLTRAAFSTLVLFGIIFVYNMVPLDKVNQTDATAQAQNVFTTTVGEYRTVELADGSVVKLNTDSVLEVNYNDSARHVLLLRGEGYFEVSSNDNRPFIVSAGEIAARAVGTAFSVRLVDMQTQVIVTEGKVSVEATRKENALTPAAEPDAISSREGPPPSINSEYVEAGQEVRSGGKGEAIRVASIGETEKRMHLSWTVGLFEFSDTPLPEVIREISRHTTTRIEIADSNLAQINFDGVFPVGDIDALLEALPEVGVDVQYINGQTVILRSAKG